MTPGYVVSEILGIVFGLAGPVIGFIMVARRAQGRARGIGMIGFGVMGGLDLLFRLLDWVLPEILFRHGPDGMDLFYDIWGIVTTAIEVLPLIILAYAVIANRLPGTQQGPYPTHNPLAPNYHQPPPPGHQQPPPPGYQQRPPSGYPHI